MEKFKVAIVGVGSIAQIVHLPILTKMEDVEIVAICDVDVAKVNAITKRFDIPRWYFLIDDLIKKEKLDAIFICTTNHYHYPMSYLALSNGINVFVEKPMALNSFDAGKLNRLAAENNLTLAVGMQNRFREDVRTLKEFIRNDELGEIYYIKSGWLKHWSRTPIPAWQTRKEYSGGGVVMDLGIQLIDLAMFLTGLPATRSVRLYDYHFLPQLDVEDSALAVIETANQITITIELSWRMPLEKDMIYTHIFGKKGAAYLNPLRIYKELHGNLVNVSPVNQENSTDRFFMAYEREIRHFIQVVQGQETNETSAQDAAAIMHIIDALYESARAGSEVRL
jgi:predicted dehydrogenase